MNFNDFMVNLCIGIISGGFSSIIVSRFFMIQTLFDEQLARVQEHIENTYRLSGILGFYLILDKKIKNPEDITEIESINTSLLNEIHNRAKQESDSFSSMIFDDLDSELHDIAVELNDYVINLEYLSKVDKNIVERICKQLNDIHSRFTVYKNKRNIHFRNCVLKDKWLRALLGILIIVVIITLLSF